MSTEEGNILTKEDIKEISKKSIPGKPNDVVVENLLGVSKTVKKFTEDTNNWFEIKEVTYHRKKKIGINTRFRWTMRRWADMSMGDYLYNKGWRVCHHRLADTYDKESHEAEMRYRKTFGEYTVYANFMVEITEQTFNKLNNVK